MCKTEQRNEVLKKPVLTPKEIAVLFDCTNNMAYRYIEIINNWLLENGRKPISPTYRGARRKVRTVDYLDFAGLPRDLLL